MSYIVVIPSRMSSTRLPGKPLMDIAGKPMVQHVWERAMQSDASDVYIAVEHEDIKRVAEGFGAKVCMTSDKHESGTDRLQEVVELLGCDDDQVVVNVQGDEPLIPPEVINQVAGLMQNPTTQMATLYEIIQQAEQLFDPNVVKLVSNAAGQALYFSRAPIPWCRDEFATDTEVTTLPTDIEYKRHIGIYAYRAKLLNQFVSWPMSNLESIEKLEQLRAMSNGIGIQVDKACADIPAGVDTQEDLELVRKVFAQG